MTVESIRLRLLLIAPLRLALSIAWLAAARAAGGRPGPALIAFAAGAFASAFLVANDPRNSYTHEPAKLPAEASVAPAWRHVVDAAIPSTIAVPVLAALTLLFQPTLTALLGGILAGIGLAALLSAYGVDGRLYLDPRTRTVFRR